ncbi:DUF2243 domain-containing protein [Phenylobacterium sp.]|uniref:DUF2243 domain-containing protein n=1 Tax=Phenylobacterium sp. TaxID=1871053 RepID=UPI0026129BE4|nr:DUF2243 domain-containing protein [Phenylobacterium sp.]
MTATRVETRDPRRSMIAAALLGIGAMAAVDEVVFHQLLAWHHFFDWSTPAFGLFSDGLLHAAELIIFALGFFMILDIRGRQALAPRSAWAGFLLGAGGFQIFDGIIDHKVLRLHQIRYGVDNLLIYDVVWNAAGVILIALGLLLARRSSGEGARAGRP